MTQSYPQWWQSLLTIQQEYQLSPEAMQNLAQTLVAEAMFIDAGHRNVTMQFNWDRQQWSLHTQKWVLANPSPTEDPAWIIAWDTARHTYKHCLPGDAVTLSMPWPQFSRKAEHAVRALLSTQLDRYREQAQRDWVKHHHNTLQIATALKDSTDVDTLVRLGSFTTRLRAYEQGPRWTAHEQRPVLVIGSRQTRHHYFISATLTRPLYVVRLVEAEWPLFAHHQVSLVRAVRSPGYRTMIAYTLPHGVSWQTVHPPKSWIPSFVQLLWPREHLTFIPYPRSQQEWPHIIAQYLQGMVVEQNPDTKQAILAVPHLGTAIGSHNANAALWFQLSSYHLRFIPLTSRYQGSADLKNPDHESHSLLSSSHESRC